MYWDFFFFICDNFVDIFLINRIYNYIINKGIFELRLVMEEL